MIRCENISKIYKTKDYNIIANRNINLEIKDGEIVWVAGVSGAGKSTLLHILSSIDIPTSGSVYWNDNEVSKLSDKERSSFRLSNIGLILQSLELLKTQSVFDFLNESSSNINKKVNEILENLKIDNLKKKKPEQLSGGQKQRVAIARALVSEAPYIFGDEISANLDMETSKFIYEYIRSTIKKRNGIGFFISHDELIEDYADKKYIMRDGGIILNI